MSSYVNKCTFLIECGNTVEFNICKAVAGDGDYANDSYLTYLNSGTLFTHVNWLLHRSQTTTESYM